MKALKVQENYYLKVVTNRPPGTADEWGIRVEKCHPVGASVERGGALNGPAAVYALEKYLYWLNHFAPPEAKEMNFTQSGSVVATGSIAQQIFWYTAFTRELLKKERGLVDKDGRPKWKMAPSPHGAYWRKGMKRGYQDAGSWTFFKSTPLARRKAAWLYAQFVTSKSVSLEKTIQGLTPIRHSDIHSQAVGDKAPYLGGLVEFYRSRAKNEWTPTGTNVPNYPLLSALWWQTIPLAITGKLDSHETMNLLARRMDEGLAKEEALKRGICDPIMAPEGEGITKEKMEEIRSKMENVEGKTASYKEALKIYE